MQVTFVRANDTVGRFAYLVGLSIKRTRVQHGERQKRCVNCIYHTYAKALIDYFGSQVKGDSVATVKTNSRGVRSEKWVTSPFSGRLASDS